ncbi:hypothetical protein NE237_004155 [Protea cynaroides]|uniref:Rho-GAP domain-containing protein n=1 Tax=Protea cynaroides TaxID=273540 RepID=A0A9Q0KIU0_9MAGN|nr:hypothetical protein NE237_004155 [Protea cynaroides]
MDLFPQGQTIFGVPTEFMQMCIYSKGNSRPTVLRRDWAINLMADIVQELHLNRMNAQNVAMVFAPNMTQMTDPSIALMSAVQVMNLLNTLIVKTLKERRDSVVETNSASHLEPYDENSHSPSQFYVKESEGAKKKTMNNARLLPDLVLGSFHKHLFPTRYIDVFYSVFSLHWLTWVTEIVMGKISAAYNQGEVRLLLDLVRNTESIDPRSFLLSRSNAGVFQHSSLFGFILSPEVFDRDLSSNSLRRSVPSTIGHLGRLKLLDLSINLFSCETPNIGLLNNFGNRSFIVSIMGFLVLIVVLIFLWIYLLSKKERATKKYREVKKQVYQDSTTKIVTFHSNPIICESLIHETQEFYCSFGNYSTLVNDGLDVLKESWNAMLFAYIWVGKLETQSPGQSSWSFHQPFDGPPISIYDESAILEQLSYQGKNQHRRCLHFQYLLKLQRNEKLLQSDRLENILNRS